MELPPLPRLPQFVAAAGLDTSIHELTSPTLVLGVQDASPLAWNTTGDVLAGVSSNHSIFVFALSGQAFKLTKELGGGHRLTVRGLLFHPREADVLISGGVEGIFVWSLASSRVMQVISHMNAVDLFSGLSGVTTAVGAHESDVECMCWTHDGSTLITGSKDTNIKAWAVAAGASGRQQQQQPTLTLLETITGHKGPVLGVAWSPETDRLASAGRDSSIKIWDVSTLAPDWRAKVRVSLLGLRACLGLSLSDPHIYPALAFVFSAAMMVASFALSTAHAKVTAVTSSRSHGPTVRMRSMSRVPVVPLQPWPF